MVNHLLIRGNKANGVEVLGKDNVISKYLASKDVILSAGVIASPQILMLSGIGDKAALHQLGIDVISHLPGVGGNLQDHAYFDIKYKCTENVSFYTEEFEAELQKWSSGKNTPLRSPGLNACAYIKTNKNCQNPDVALYFLPLAMASYDDFILEQCHAYSIFVIPCSPASRGTVTLQSCNPHQYPRIDQQYFSAEEDMQVLFDGIDIAQNLQTKSLLILTEGSV